MHRRCADLCWSACRCEAQKSGNLESGLWRRLTVSARSEPILRSCMRWQHSIFPCYFLSMDVTLLSSTMQYAEEGVCHAYLNRFLHGYYVFQQARLVQPGTSTPRLVISLFRLLSLPRSYQDLGYDRPQTHMGEEVRFHLAPQMCRSTRHQRIGRHVLP